MASDYKQSGFIDEALAGGSGPSEQVVMKNNIKTAFAMDNVELAMDIETSIKDDKFGGGIDNLKHSLKGASAVQDGI